MVDEKNQSDQIAHMLSIDNETDRAKSLPDAELNTDAPEDKKQPERDDAGKFKGKDGEKPDDKKADDKKPDAKKPDEKPLEEKPKDTVPLATFLEKTNKLKADLEARDITLKEFQTKLAALEAKLTPAPEKAKEPDFVEDPKGYVDHKLGETLSAIEAANKKAEEEGKKTQETAAAAAEQVQVQQFFQNLQVHERRFEQEHPDYHDALLHIRNIRAAQIREFNPEATAEQIVGVIRQEETQLAINLARQGRDPIQVAWNMAQHYGYKPKTKDVPKIDAELPDAKEKRLPPDQTLGSGGGTKDDDDPAYKQDETDPVDLALASLFKKRA